MILYGRHFAASCRTGDGSVSLTGGPFISILCTDTCYQIATGGLLRSYEKYGERVRYGPDGEIVMPWVEVIWNEQNSGENEKKEEEKKTIFALHTFFVGYFFIFFCCWIIFFLSFFSVSFLAVTLNTNTHCLFRFRI